MGMTEQLYGPSLALLTDLYQLTMAYGYWKTGRAGDEATFHLFFRKHPFQGGYTIATGLEYIVDFIRTFQFTEEDVDYLRTLCGNDGKPLFNKEFLAHLQELEQNLTVSSVPEGTLVFPQQPLVRVQGPLLLCQLVETPLLNIVNFQTLIATKAARICQAARGEPVLEFGLRRAQGVDGAISAARAAYIGGCAATSNVLAGKLLGIPVKGTHAHSWVMTFEDELESFRAYAEAMPNNCVFLVDTYDTLEGVKNAITVGRELRERGHELLGIRLDSGDLAYLSIEARRLLDAAGFPKAAIVASNDLDEGIIDSLKGQGAAIAVWGVGTKLVTAYDQPALGGVYKLAAVRRPGEDWRYKVKLSEQEIKISIPGVLQTRRFRTNGLFKADMIYDLRLGAPQSPTIIDPIDPEHRIEMRADAEYEDLLIPVFEEGKQVCDPPPLADCREKATRQLHGFHEGVRRLLNPHQYTVGIEASLYDLRARLIMEARQGV